MRQARDVQELAALAAASGAPRPIEPRLTGGFGYYRCAPEPTPASLVPEPRCSALPGEDTRAPLESQAVERGPGESFVTAEAVERLHVQGIANLVSSRSQRAVEWGIAALEEALAKEPRNASLLSDLAAAYVLRAQRQDEPQDLVWAYAAVERALEAAPSFREARFNRALILEKLYLEMAASAAWREYLEIDATSDWGREAADHLAALTGQSWEEEWQRDLSALEEAAAHGDRRTVHRLVDQYRQPVREHVLESLLPDWAEARTQEEMERAARALQIARSIGVALVELSSDPTVRDAVAAIDAAGEDRAPGSRLSFLLKGHQLYRQGRKTYQKTQFGGARKTLSDAREALRRGGSPVAGWAELFTAVCVYYAADYDNALALLLKLAQDPSSAPYPSLQGRVLYNIGILRAVQGDLEGSLVSYLESRSLFEPLRETENMAAVRHVLAQTFDFLGQPGEGWKHRYHALSALRDIPNPDRRSSIFDEAAEASIRQNHLQLALALQSELLQSAPSAWSRPLAFLGRGLVQLRLGHQEAARRDLEQAEDETARIEDLELRSNLRTEIRFAKGELLLADDPSSALAHLEEGLDLYRKTGRRVHLAQAFLQRARAFEALKDLDRAEADLLSGIREEESKRDRIAEQSLQISFFEESRSVYDEMIRLQVRRGRAEAALSFVERARSRALLDQLAKLPAGARKASPSLAVAFHPLNAAEIQSSLPDAVALLEYAVLGEQVVAWAVRNEEITMVPLGISREDLDTLVRRFLRKLAKRSDATAAQADAAELYNYLIRPLEVYLEGHRTLAVVPDARLYSVPFAALYDTRRSRFLVQDHDLVIAPSATVYLACRERDLHFGDGVSTSVLSIGNPAFARHLFPNLADLPASLQEATQIARLYPISTLLTNAEATAERFLELARESEVVHFAGHAHSNEAFPMLSALLLAPGTAGDSGVLLARRLYAERFYRTRLVVLAACSTARGQASRSEGAIGLARPFLAAGVPAVVASLSDIEDQATSSLLMSFHRHLRTGKTPIGALGAAQREAIQDPDPAGRALWTWASFEVIGGTRTTPP